MALVAASGLASFDITLARRVDLSDVMSAILVKAPGLLPKLAKGEAARDTTHKWPEDSLAPNTVTVNEDTFSSSDPADGGTLVLASGHPQRLRIGQLLQDIAAGKTEVFQVLTIDSATQITITRGYGSTSPEAHAVNCTLRVIGSPIQENFVEAAANDIWSAGPSEAYNYTQLFERPVAIGDTLQRIAENGIIAGVKNMISHQIEKRTQEMTNELNDSIINGIRSASAGSDSIYRTMMGLIEFLSQGSSLLITTAEAFSESVANTMMKACYDQGAEPTTLLVSSELVDAITAWDESRVRTTPDAKVVGHYITRWRSELGIEVDILVDRYVPGDAAALLNLKDIKWMPLQGDDWHGETLARSGRVTITQLSGQFTLEVRNALKGHCLHRNLS